MPQPLKLISSADLIGDRGWDPEMIDELLGVEDFIVRHPNFPRKTLKLFVSERVLHAQAPPGVQYALDVLTKRTKRAGKRASWKELIAEGDVIHRMENVRLALADVTVDDMLAGTIEHLQQKFAPDALALVTSDRRRLNSFAISYAIQNLVDYDGIAMAHGIADRVELVKKTLRNRVYALLQSAYPELWQNTEAPVRASLPAAAGELAAAE